MRILGIALVLIAAATALPRETASPRYVDDVVLQSLIECLGDDDPGVRAAARTVLVVEGRRDARPLFAALRVVVFRIDRLVQQELESVLSEIGQPILGDAITLLDDPDWRMRIAAVHVLAGIDDPRAKRALEAARLDADPDVAAEAGLPELRPADGGETRR